METATEYDTNQDTQEQLPDIHSWVFAQGDDLKTDSRIVAKVFGKKHYHVLRDIRQLIEEQPDFAKSNFGFCQEINDEQNGKLQPYYEITQDGFVILVMGWTGKEAMEIKIRYIAVFNEMRRMINDCHYGLIAQLHRALQVEAVSKVVASLAGKTLNRRRGEKRINHANIERLQQQLQPDMFAALFED